MTRKPVLTKLVIVLLVVSTTAAPINLLHFEEVVSVADATTPTGSSQLRSLSSNFVADRGRGIFDCAFPEYDLSEYSASADGNSEVVIGLSTNPAAYLGVLGTVDRFGGRLFSNVSCRDGIMAVAVEVPTCRISSLRGHILQNGLARYVEPNARFQTTFEPDDPYWPLQWGPEKIEANFAWNTTVGSDAVLVAVLDTGIDYTHPDLASRYVPLGYDWVNGDSDPLDDQGHGTHCAGIIGASLNNGLGVAGLAQVRIMAEKVLDFGGIGVETWIMNGIYHAVDQNASIISMSLGGSVPGGGIHDAIKYAYEHGVLLIAAAGNNHQPKATYPAAYSEVVAVSATDQDDALAEFSNYGEEIELAAPGVDIYSTMPSYHVTLNDMGREMDYCALSGTSMSCPCVAGVAALIWSRFPNVSRDWVVAQMKTAADDLGTPGVDDYFGYGRVNAKKAVEAQNHDLLILDANVSESSRIEPGFVYKEPHRLQPEENVCFEATLLNLGLTDEEDAQVQLLVNGSLVDASVVSHFASGSSTQITVSWMPLVEGTYNVTFYVSPVVGEAIIVNNVLTKILSIRYPIARILWSFSHCGCLLSMFYLTWAQTLFDRGYSISVFESGLISLEMLNDYDIYVIPVPGCVFSPDEILAIQDFVLGGGGLFLFDGSSEPPDGTPSEVDTSITSFAGISWAPTSHLWRWNTSSIVSHPVTEGVASACFPAPQKQLLVNSPATNVIFDNVGCNQGALAVSEAGAGRVAALADLGVIHDFANTQYDNLRLNINIIDWLSRVKREHELFAGAEIPSHVEPGESALLNATLHNSGLNNETDLELRLIINGSVVTAVNVPELLVGESCTLSYSWTSPSETAVCNVTAFVPSLLTEDVESNNARSKIISVHPPIIQPIEGQYANYSAYYYAPLGNLLFKLSENYTYQSYVGWHKINMSKTYDDPFGNVYVGNYIVDTMNRFVDNDGMWYRMWIETGVGIGSKVNVWDGYKNVTGSKLYKGIIDCWEIPFIWWGYSGTVTSLYDMTSGVLLRHEWRWSNSIFHYPYTKNVVQLSATNIPIGNGERDMALLNMSSPRTVVSQNMTTSVNIVIKNQGQCPEIFNATLHANSTEVASRTVWMDIGDSKEIQLDWNTTGFDYGNYQLEARIDLPEDTNSSNNEYGGVSIILTNPPSANFEWLPSSPRSIETISFDASSSIAGWNGTDTIVRCEWDFGDGATAISFTLTATHAYTNAGSYEVKLRVIDNEGLIDSITHTLEVKLMGDTNDDGRVDMRDVRLIADAFGAYPEHLRWNIDSDLDRNGRIDMRDIGYACVNFGKHT